MSPSSSPSLSTRVARSRSTAQSVTAFEAIHQANQIGGRHGVGIGVHLVENRFVGVKSRGVYEAPGMELAGKLLRLPAGTGARPPFSRAFRRPLADARASDLPGLRLRHRQPDGRTGAVSRLRAGHRHHHRLALAKGSVHFAAASDVPHSLYSEENASMEDIGEFDHADSEGFLARAFRQRARSGRGAADHLQGLLRLDPLDDGLLRRPPSSHSGVPDPSRLIALAPDPKVRRPCTCQISLGPPTRAEGFKRLESFSPRAGRDYAHGSQPSTRARPTASNVSTLSPWIRHRLVREDEVVAAVLEHHSVSDARQVPSGSLLADLLERLA